MSSTSQIWIPNKIMEERNTEATVDSEETVYCPLGNHPVLISDFGVDRSRESGRHLYCKPCIRLKVNTSRRLVREARRERRELQKQQRALPLIAAVPQDDEIRNPNCSHHSRVLLAIRRGARTAVEIALAVRSKSVNVAGLGHGTAFVEELDQVGESVAILLFNTPRLIQVETVDNTAMYSPAPPPRKPSNAPALSFSTLGGILAPITKGRAA